MQIRDITLKQKEQLDTKADKQDIIRAKIVAVNGAVWASLSQKRVWYQAYGASQPAQILNVRVKDVYENMAVLIGRPEGSTILQVLAVDEFILQSPDIPLPGQVDKHDHRRGSNNFYPVEVEAIESLMVFPVGSLSLVIRPGWYNYNGTRKYYNGNIINLTSNLPTSGNHRRVGVYITSGNTVATVNGTEVLTTIEPSDPTWPSGAGPLVTVLLRYDDAVIPFNRVITAKPAFDLLATSPGGWPADSTAKIDTTEYSTAVLARNATLSASAYTVKFGPGTFSLNGVTGSASGAWEVANSQTITILGSGQRKTIITYSGALHTLNVNHASGYFDLYNVAVTEGTTNTTYIPIIVQSGALYASHCSIEGVNYNSAANGQAISVTGGTVELIDCNVTLSNAGSAPNDKGLHITGGTCTIRGGVIDGEDYDVYVNGGTVVLDGPTLVNGTLEIVSGTVSGWYYDAVLERIVDLGAIGTVAPRGASGRLTLSSGVPVTTADVSGSTLGFTPFDGNTIKLYDGSIWVDYEFTEIQIAVPSTQWRLFDVFIFDNSGTLVLETVNWNQLTGTVNGATNAQPIVITDTSHGLTTGDIIMVNNVVGNTAANGLWTETVTGTNTYSLDHSQGNGTFGISSPIWWRLNETRATALTTQDGILVKSGDATRRYLGTGMTNGTSGQCEDSRARRFLFNYYNRRNRALFNQDTTIHTYTTATARRFNNDGLFYTAWITGLAENDTNPNIITNLENSSANASQVRMYHNATLLQALAHGVVARLPLAFASVITPATGFNFLQSVALGNGADTSWRSTSLNGIIQG